jgi:CheY-like chemotaxis protein
MVEGRSRKLVFVVDDEEIIASTLATILNSSGFEAASFTAPLEALQVARFRIPDLLISDVLMPVLSGIELALKIKEICPDCKILLFSGQAATTDLLMTHHADGQAFEVLQKPIHPSVLLKKVRAAVAIDAGALPAA